MDEQTDRWIDRQTRGGMENSIDGQAGAAKADQEDKQKKQTQTAPGALQGLQQYLVGLNLSHLFSSADLLTFLLLP